MRARITKIRLKYILALKKIVLCHGVFDLLHFGHLNHFEKAKSHGDILVVSLTPDKFVNKGPSRPAFKESVRLEMLASLEIKWVLDITDLWLNSNQLTELPESITNLTQLKSLQLEDNQFSDSEKNNIRTMMSHVEDLSL